MTIIDLPLCRQEAEDTERRRKNADSKFKEIEEESKEETKSEAGGQEKLKRREKVKDREVQA